MPKSIVPLLLAIVFSIGCGDGYDIQGEVAKDNNENIRRLVTCYSSFQAQNGESPYMGPKDEAEFREFLNGTAAQNFLNYIGVDGDKIDELMISERDGKPFVFRWGVQGSPRGSDDPLLFEDTGIDGKRMVGFSSHRFIEATPEQYDKWFNGDYEPGELDNGEERNEGQPGR